MRSEIEDWLVKKAGTWLRTRQDLTAERLEQATRSKAQQLRRSLPLTCRVLEEAFKLGGCVICQILHEFEKRSLFSFLYEGMMTTAVCQKFLAGGGFCPRHFWLATHLGLNFWSVGAFEIANLCKPLVTEARMLLNQAKGHRRPTRLRLPWNRRTENRTASAGHDCIFCRENRNREQGLIGVLEGLVDEEDFGHSLATNGLCLPHAQPALHAWKQSSKREWLEGLISQHMAELTRDLDEFIRKYEHRHRHEPFGREVDVVRRAMEFLVGLESHIPSGKGQ